MEFRSTEKLKLKSEVVCLLYEPQDGSIVHTHRVLTLAGAEETPSAAVETRARELATSFGLAASKLGALVVDGRKLDPCKDYRVDPTRKRLVAIRRKPDPSPAIPTGNASE
jgi:hypothetical protein